MASVVTHLEEGLVELLVGVDVDVPGVVLERRLAVRGKVALELKRRAAEERADGKGVVEQRRRVGRHDWSETLRWEKSIARWS